MICPELMKIMNDVLARLDNFQLGQVEVTWNRAKLFT